MMRRSTFLCGLSTAGTGIFIVSPASMTWTSALAEFGGLSISSQLNMLSSTEEEAAIKTRDLIKLFPSPCSRCDRQTESEALDMRHFMTFPP